MSDSSAPTGSGGPRPISIWRPRQLAGELVFERPRPQALGDHYAARRRLHAAKRPGCRRICLFGESAAAGYLYAPHVTPAQVIEAQLNALAEAPGRYEVIDLARTDERLGSLVETARRAMQLQPDLLIVFAGNNWSLLETPEISPYHPSVEGRRAFAADLREGGLSGPARRAAKKVLRLGAAALAEVGALAGAAEIPVIVVVPEVNLADWETLQPVPWLSADRSRRWHHLFARARRSTASGDWAGVASAAAAMLELDPMVGPTAHRLSARSHQEHSDLEAAATACREEIASVHYPTLACLAAPQAWPMTQELLRRGSERHGFDCVDLTAVFAARVGSPLPGRRMFLDYCHLTAEGIRVCGAAISAAVLRRLVGSDLGWEDVLRRTPEPPLTGETEAATCLGAAVHTSHRLLASDRRRAVIKHWIRKGLEASPAAARTMLDFVEARYAATPAVLTAAMRRIQDSPLAMTLQHGWRWDYLDLGVGEAIVEVLEGAGIPCRERVSRLAAGAGVVDGSPLELAGAPYLWEPLEQLYPEAMATTASPERAFLRSIWPNTSFALPAGGDRSITLHAVLRSGCRGSSSAVGVRVNGRKVGRLAAGGEWQGSSIAVAGSVLRPGINRVILDWPPAAGTGEEALQLAAERLEAGLEADLHPIFGEVFSLKATPA